MFGGECVVGVLGSGTPPSGLAISQTAYETLKLDWTNNEPAQQTRIYRKVDAGSFTLLTTVAAGVATYTNNGLEAGKTYQYYVRHFDGTRMSDPSNTPAAITLAVAAPAGLTGSVVAGDPFLEWTNGDALAETVIRRDFADYDTVAAGVDSYTDVGVDGEFTYDVKHLRNGEESELSAPVVVDTGTGAPSGDPSGLSATAAGTNSIDLSWTNGDASATTEIERSLDGSTGWAVITTAAAGATSYTNTGLTAGTAYYYRARHLKNALYSSYSATANATTNALPVLSGVSAAHHTGGNCSSTYATNRVSYTISGNVTGYTLEIECSIDGAAPILVDSISPPATGTTYHTLFFEHVDALNGVLKSYEYTARLYSGSQDATGSPVTPTSIEIVVDDCP